MKSIFTIACALALTGASARAEETFHIVQQKPELVHIDLGKDGASHGDILAFEAGFTSLAHTDADIDATITAFRDSFAAVA